MKYFQIPEIVRELTKRSGCRHFNLTIVCKYPGGEVLRPGFLINRK